MIVIKAPAKINLCLHVGAPNKAIDAYHGYHKLESLVTFAIDCFDVIELFPADQLSLEINGEFAENLLGGTNNLVLKAAEILKARFAVNVGARIVLEKNLPIASGIGGGSSDCAATIIGLDKLWGLGLSQEEMAAIAQKIGSDIPACLRRHPLIMKGYGEILEEAPSFPELPALLINPLIGVDTAAVYKKYDLIGNFPPDLALLCSGANNVHDAANVLKLMRNDLEAAAVQTVPKIGKLLEFLKLQKGQLFCRMSGSGATSFAIFDTMDNARLAQKTAIANFDGANGKIWAKATMLQGNN